MHRMKSLVVNVVLNILTLAIIPILVLVWLVRVHTIEFLQARERTQRQQASLPARRGFGLHADRGRRRTASLHGRASPRF